MRLVTVLLLAGCATLFASEASGQQYPFLHVDGSPEGVSEMFQDSSGLMWISTAEEFFAFDGAHFYSLQPFGYPKSGSFAIAEDGDGGIWSATRAGLYRFHHAKLESFLAGRTTLSVVRISPDLLLAAAFPAGKSFEEAPQIPPVDLFRIRKANRSWIVEPLSNWQSRGFLTVDSSGSTIYPCTDGWCEIPAKLAESWHPGDSSSPILHDFKSFSARIFRDPSGCVWFRSSAAAGYQLNPASPVQLYPETGTIDNFAKIGTFPDKSVVILGGGKIVYGRPGNFHTIRATNGLPYPEAVFATKDGTIWIGSPKGLFRVPQSFNLEFWTGRDGLEYPLSEVHIGKNVYAASGQGIRVLSPERENWRRLGDPLKFGMVLHLAPGPNDSIVAGRFDGITQIAPDGKILADAPRDAYRNPATMILNTPDKKTWISGMGVRSITINPGKLIVSEPEGPYTPSHLYLDLDYQPRTNQLWACSPSGLMNKKDGAWRLFTTKEGLLEDPCISVAATPDGDAWFGYGTNGKLARLHLDASGNPQILNFGDTPFIGSAAVQFLGVDRRGWLWRGSPDGIHIAKPSQAAASFWFDLGSDEGLPETSGNQQSFYDDPDGSVWFGVQNSIVHFTPPTDLLEDSSPPPIFVSGFTAGQNKPVLAQSMSSLPHGNPVTAHVGSIYFQHRGQLRFRYRLSPGQSDWKDAETFDLALGELSWGAHTLQVQSRIGFGPWSDPISYTFWVAKPLWLTWPALLSFVVVGFVSSAAGRTIYLRRLALRNRRLPELSPWRIATLLPEIQEFSGTLLDNRFEVRELIARGGFANVMDGFDRLHNRRCAIKFFRGEVGKNEWIMRHFQHEVAALQQVSHPNIVPIIAHGTTESGVPYLVMEYVDGKSLREILDGGPIAPNRAARFLKQLAGALDAIHKQEICHRDVKPENLMIRNSGTPDEELVLIDFSISLVKDANETLHGISRAAGSFDYMAPEQAIGFAQPSTDIYSVTKVLLEILTGKRLSALLPGASMDLPARVRELLPTLPIKFSQASVALLSAALEFDPSHRPQEILSFSAPIVTDLESQNLS